MSTITLTDEVIAFARAVIAAVEKPVTKRERRYLVNPRTGTLHNPGCQAESRAVPLTRAEIAAMFEPGSLVDCMACGSGAFEQPYDTVEVQA